MMIHPRRLVLIPLLLVSLAAASFARVGDPADHVSHSGEYSLHVEPSEPRGGVGTYTLTRGEREVWSRELPYTLTEVAVADDGMFAGSVETTRNRESIMIVVRVSATGELLMEYTVEQTWHEMHGPSYPLAKDLFLQPALKRFVVLVAGPEHREEWWVFDYASGAPPEVHYSDERPGFDRSCTSSVGRAVPGTPLTLIYRHVNEYPEFHARFVLLDEDWNEVWRLDVPDDYTALENHERFALWDTGAILATGRNSFEVRLVREDLHLEFRVWQDPDAPTGWSVAEVDRQPFVPPTPALVQLEAQDLELVHLGSVQLGKETDPKAATIRDVRAFGVERDGQLSFVRSEGHRQPDRLLTLDATGALLREQQFPELDLGEEAWLSWTFLGEGVYLVTSESLESVDDAPFPAWTVDVDKGLVHRLADLPDGFNRAEGIDGGGFVAIVDRDEVARYAPDGTLLWRREGIPRAAPQTNAYSVNFEDLAVTTEGRVAVLEFSSKQVLIFELDGTFSHAFSLEEAVPQELRYPNGLSAGLDGGLLLDDSIGSPPIWRLSIDGACLGSLDPRYPDGRTPPGLVGNLRGANDGHLWSTDGTAIVRLDKHGTVDRVLGSDLTTGRLEEPSFAFVDPLGRILVSDYRTGFVHVFDRSGAELLVCRPAPEDFESSSRRVAVAGDGSVFLSSRSSRDAPTVEFAPDGTRLGPCESHRREHVFKPGSSDYWQVVAYSGGIELVSVEGKVEARVDRRPDRTWIGWVGGIALAPDGSLAILEGSASPRSWSREKKLSLYAADGAPQRMYLLPDDVSQFWLSYNGLWIALDAEDGPGYLLHVADGSLHQVHLPDEHADLSGFTGFSPDGHEIWWIDGTRVERFALPVR